VASVVAKNNNMNESRISISTHPVKYHGNRMVYEFETTHGMLDSVLDPAIGWLGIANIDVERGHRRQGIGKALLRAALEFAQEQDVRYVHAAIISRECLDAMVSVFGEDALQIKNTGSYEEEGSADSISMTQASLWYEVKHSIETLSQESSENC
jgi:GNAT superfamily N-acetyltransferase